ncbi:hypothetical protein APR41_10435 [Salegentibacter salinarum]|uniref:Uncharacterized protein n=1 Tax=Salegentibacter salinarum TaxID=447422 RepID=A0A2N0TN97_9FLAO|nr:hypothetical protein [Salegentibacter salinarum]PKD16195.1 hypothetical protein APR41_10435 [Salegentibacter salinarum]SKB68053.1 hypothetical protein SAMN05660903_02017 [Salegentibacter salinarum]
MLQYNSSAITPTANFIDNLHTGIFQEILPGIFIIKGAKNDRGFDQAYMILNQKKELILIDAVEEAYQKAIANLLSNGFIIRAILITGKDVLNDCYIDPDSLSKSLGNAEVYISTDISPQGVETKDLTDEDSLLKKFELEGYKVPKKEGQIILYCDRHNGIIFTGNSAMGSDYGGDEFIFTRGREEDKEIALAVEEFWKGFIKEFEFLFPRQGKLGIQIDDRTRVTLLKRLSSGESGLK